MWKGELTIEDAESMTAFFENTTLVSEEEQAKAEKVIEESDQVNWPIEVVLEIEEDTWEEWASKHPDEAKAIEPHLGDAQGAA